MSGYLIYHPKRCISTFGDIRVYHDSTNDNQDPYVWNKQFLHTYCHITQIRSDLNFINFWVCGDTFPLFSHLYCDLIFVVARKEYWQQNNTIDVGDPIVDSDEAFLDHYQWAKCQHHYKRRRRFTLKADASRSFQPQDANKELIDIVPCLVDAGLTLDTLRLGLRSNKGSKPFFLTDDISTLLYDWLDQRASIKLCGEQLQQIRQDNPQLGPKRGTL
jgi:hypothetical protein